MRVTEEQYNQIFHCKCGHRPVVKKEFRSCGIVSGTSYWYFIICYHCKSKSKRFTHWREEKAIKRATNDWNKRLGQEKVMVTNARGQKDGIDEQGKVFARN